MHLLLHMHSQKRYIFVLSLIFILLFIVSQSSAQRNLPLVHQPFQDFTLPSLDGIEVSLSDFYGKSNVVLVTYRGWVGFW